jgi:hypoxanthine phosphoribosyltransferase
VKIQRLSWEQIEKASEIVSSKIMKGGFKPDLCVAISRGGFVPARLICDRLDVSELACVRIEYYSGINETLVEPRITSPLNADAKNKSVLIVDDVADRGNSLILAKKHVQDAGAREIKVATLHYKPWSKIEPDFYALEVESWIVYPWEVFEATKQISSKLIQEGKSPGEVRRYLSKIKLSESETQKTLGKRSHN